MPVEVVEAYKNYTPPIDALKVTQLLLRYVPQDYQRELESIVLTNTDALSRERRRSKVQSGSRVTEVRGLYYEPWNGRPARIEIFVDKALLNCTPWEMKFSVIKQFVLSDVLYHEIGHHMQFLEGKSTGRQREKLAEQYERKLYDRFFQQRYWYLWPFIAILRWVRKAFMRLIRNFLPSA